MRIISKEHDYYDPVMYSGMDKECLYIRKKQEIFITDNRDFSKKDRFNRNANGGYLQALYPSIGNKKSEYFYLIGFCGNIYPVKEIRYYPSGKQKFLYKKQKNEKTNWWNKSIFDLNWNHFNVLFEEYKVPVFTIKKEGYDYILTLNDELKQFEFQKIKDPYTAYQDIYMYLSGVIGTGQKELVEISNDDMLKKKGFDDWSFKKQKHNRKNK